MTLVDAAFALDQGPGGAHDHGGGVALLERGDGREGLIGEGYDRYVDAVTSDIGTLAANFEDVQKLRKSIRQREIVGQEEPPPPSTSVQDLVRVEERFARALRKALESHPLWPWLEPLKGLAGPLTARVLACIQDPRRFPGQRCSEGHYLAPNGELGQPCPVNVSGERCPGIMLAPRPGTGVRSLWHYAGLHVVDGKLARLRKGQQGSWNVGLRTLTLQPHGLADQIVLARTPVYRDVYDQKRAQLEEFRTITEDDLGDAEDGGDGPNNVGNAELRFESDGRGGVPPILKGPGVDVQREREPGSGLRPFQVHAIARTVAAKAFLGDLLIEWKRVAS